MKHFTKLNQKHNVVEGINGKTFDVPEKPSRFLHSTKLDFRYDPWRNVIPTIQR